MSKIAHPKAFPVFRSDEEAEDFVAGADLSQYDLSGFSAMPFEFEKKSAQLNMRLPSSLLDAVKQAANERGIPYTRFIRETLESSITRRKTR